MPYHAGLVVPDMRAAIRDLESRLGHTFNEPTRLTVHEVEDRLGGTTGPLEMLVAYTRDRPFRMEVIECQGRGIYSPAQAGLHHLGVWEPDPVARLKWLETAGDPVDAVFRQPDGTISVIYARSAAVPAHRIEYVNEAQRERLERWFDTGVLS
ncbi:VOC family protein [Amycolatopsis sp. K13G38]|uniref:VOC family protein n=2 Tax=Amycolatopsis acididurans TaxID=2724524 RepID=A0ABX1J391_9PSEU|nr:VOC family protein [Amycolatopsis acididurans]